MVVAHGGVYQVIEKEELGVKTWDEFYSDGHYRRPDNGELKLIYDTTDFKPSNKLDRWIISEINTLTKDMTAGLDQYDLIKGLDPLVRFIDSLTNWYIRRSRRRFWKSENDQEKHEAYQTLYIILVEVCKLLAPFAPFLTEAMYRNLTGMQSVHLTDWPDWHDDRIDAALNQEIETARQIVTLGHAARARANIKVRQPLSQIEVALPPSYSDKAKKQLEEQLDVIQEELNVKEVKFLDSTAGKVKIIVKPNGKILGPKLGAAVQEVIREAKAGNYTQLKSGNYQVLDHELTPEEIEIAYESLEEGSGKEEVEADQGIVVILNTKLTAELQREGYARDIVRTIQDLRKQADLNVADRIKVSLSTDAKDVQKAINEFENYIMKETLAVEISAEKLTSTWESVLNLGEHGVVISIEKI